MELTSYPFTTGTSHGTASAGAPGSPWAAGSAPPRPRCRGARTGSTFLGRALTLLSGNIAAAPPPVPCHHLTVPVRHKWWDGQRWGGWESLGGSFPSSTPSSVSWGENRLDIFSVGNNGAVWHKWWDGRRWGGWESLGGFFSNPSLSSVSWGPNRIDVFGIGTDRALWHQWWDGRRWGRWESLGGTLDSEPYAVSWGSNRIDVFALGTDKAVWHKWWDGRRWSNWESLGGQFTQPPTAVSDQSNRLNVYGVGTDGNVWEIGWDGNRWSSWQSLRGPTAASTPSVTSWGPGRVDVFIQGTNKALWHNW